MRPTVFLLLAAGTVLGCGTTTQQALVRPGPQDITILFAEDANQRCTKQLPLPAVLSTRGSHITWHIVNLCTRPITVAVVFTGHDPLVPPVKEARNVPPYSAGTPPPGNSKIETTVAGQPPDSNHEGKVISYAYAVHLDGDPVNDPEIIIDWTVPLQ